MISFLLKTKQFANMAHATRALSSTRAPTASAITDTPAALAILNCARLTKRVTTVAPAFQARHMPNADVRSILLATSARFICADPANARTKASA